MAFLSSMNIAASGLTAQRLRMDTISENIANINTTRTEGGGAYRRKMVVFEPISDSSFAGALRAASGQSGGGQAGVRVSAILEDESEFKMVYNPDHPDAEEDGYVRMPNVDLTKETVDAMEASRAYDANINAFNAIKLMAQKALDIGK